MERTNERICPQRPSRITSIREMVLRELDWGNLPEDEAIQRKIEDTLLSDEQLRQLPANDRLKLQKELFDSLRRFDVISDALDDDRISEIMIIGAKKIFFEREGHLVVSDRSFSSEEMLMDLIQRIVAGVNRTVNASHPIVDARLPDGSRVNVVLPPISLCGGVVTIRKFANHRFTMDKMVEMKSISQEAADFLDLLVKARYNILISGGTGSGKTTLLNALSSFIPADQRVITIEDSAELQLQHIENLVRLETRNASVDGTGEVTIRDLIKTSLRMRPDRIVVGEVRGAEVIDMLQAMNTGHDGSLSTGHANSAYDMLIRLETMVLLGMDIPLLAVRAQIASAIDIIVQIARLRDGSRKILSVSELLMGDDGKLSLNELFVFRETGEKNGKIEGRLERTKQSLLHVEKLHFAGYDKGELASSCD